MTTASASPSLIKNIISTSHSSSTRPSSPFDADTTKKRVTNHVAINKGIQTLEDKLKKIRPIKYKHFVKKESIHITHAEIEELQAFDQALNRRIKQIKKRKKENSDNFIQFFATHHDEIIKDFTKQRDKFIHYYSKFEDNSLNDDLSASTMASTDHDNDGKRDLSFIIAEKLGQLITAANQINIPTKAMPPSFIPCNGEIQTKISSEHPCKLLEPQADLATTIPIACDDGTDNLSSENDHPLPLNPVKNSLFIKPLTKNDQPFITGNRGRINSSPLLGKKTPPQYFTKQQYSLFEKPIRIAAEQYYQYGSDLIDMSPSDYPDILVNKIPTRLESIKKYRIPSRMHPVIDNDVVFIALKDSQGHIYLSFFGMTNIFGANLATYLGTIINNLLGLESQGFRNANNAVSEFIKRYGKENITLVGHSFGGALASYAAIKNDLPAISINGMGLSQRIVNKLAKTHDTVRIANINTKNDWLTQFIQPLFLTQVGECYNVDQFEGHIISRNGFKQSLTDTLDNIFLHQPTTRRVYASKVK